MALPHDDYEQKLTETATITEDQFHKQVASADESEIKKPQRTINRRKKGEFKVRRNFFDRPHGPRAYHSIDYDLQDVFYNRFFIL